ncbi:hypothetical protein [Cupriavidus taiwanensis]|nr:hypothetical protein [Cupriavidus taiwanensis]
MSEKDGKSNFRKELAIAIFTTVMTWLLGKVDGWLEKSDAKVPDWLMDFAAWFARATPINNTLLLWCLLSGAMAFWLLVRFVVLSRRVHAQHAAALEKAQRERSADAAARQQIEEKLTKVRGHLSMRNEELDKAKEDLAVARQQIAGANPRPKTGLASYVPPPSPAHNDLFREATIEHVHWRWDYHPNGQPLNMRSFCEKCDMPLKLNEGHRSPSSGYLNVACRSCRHTIHMTRTDIQEANNARDIIERAIRLDIWSPYLKENQLRKDRISKDAAASQLGL